MAFAVNASAIYNFDSQGVNDFAKASAAGASIVSTPVLSKQSRVLQLDSGDWWESRNTTLSGDWRYSCWHFRVTKLSLVGYKDFFQAMGTSRCWALAVNPSGTIRMRDAAGTTKFTSASGKIAINTWYTAVSVWSQLDAGKWSFWFGETDSTITRLATEIAGDYRPTTVGPPFHRHEWNQAAAKQFVADGALYVDLDTGASPHADLDPPPLEFRVIGPLSNNTNTSTTADFGPVASAGAWSNGSAIPINDATTVSHNNSSRSGVSCDGASLNGPKGNTDFNNAVIGCCQFYRSKESKSSFFGKSRVFVGANATATTDGLGGSLNTSGTSFTNYYNYTSKLGDSPDAECPTISEYLQFGLRGRPPGSSQTIVCSTMYGLVHHEESVVTTKVKDVIGMGVIPFAR